MAFTLFTPIFEKFDTATAEYVTNISTKLIATITPIISLGLTVGFLVYGMAVIRGLIDNPVHDVIGRMFKIGIIVSIATAGGLYQSEIAGVILATPDELATALVDGDGSRASAGGILDDTATYAFDLAAEKWEKAGLFSKQGLMYVAYSLLILLSASLLVAVGGAFIIMAKVALALIVALGPLFIFMLMWQATHRFFEAWVSQALNYGLLIVLVSILFLFLMGIYGNYMSDITADNAGLSAIYTLAGAIIISLIAIIILLQLPSMAGALSNGVGLGFIWELALVAKGVGGFGKRGADGKLTGAKGVLGAARVGTRAAIKTTVATVKAPVTIGKTLTGLARKSSK